MLNKNDVQFGNCVEYDNRYFTIDTIAEEFPTLNTIEFGIGVIDWNNIKPIKLDGDLLELINFKFGQRGWVDWWTLHINDFGVINIDLEYNKVQIGGGISGYIMLPYPIEYLHDLQNLFHILTKKHLNITKLINKKNEKI